MNQAAIDLSIRPHDRLCLPLQARFVLRPQLLTRTQPLPVGRDIPPVSTFSLIPAVIASSFSEGGSAMAEEESALSPSSMMVSERSRPTTRAFPLLPMAQGYGLFKGEWQLASWG
jgi:hypothetical protein